MSVPSTILRDLRMQRQQQERPLATADWSRGQGGLRRHEARDFFLGYQDDGTPLAFADEGHVLMVAGTRAGKGASVLIPNLCIYPGSVVVIDPKGENAIVTARRRAGGSRYCKGIRQKVVLLDPFHAVHTPEDDFSDLRGGFNPMDLVDPARPESIGDASRIADALVVSEGSKDPYWEESARSLIKAIILHVASSNDYPPSSRNLVTVWKLVMAGDAARNAIAARSGGTKDKPGARSLLFKAMARNPAFGGAVAQAGTMFGDLDAKAARTLANIAQIASSSLEFMENPEMQACLSRSSLALSELKTNERSVSLYLSLPQAYMGTHYRWMRMVSTLLIAEMERHRMRLCTGHPVLMVLDEFAALKRMGVIENAAAQIAGFGVRMVFAVQTLAQLQSIYKDNWETLVANSGVKLFFGNDDHFTRDYVSKLVGETEIVRTLTTISETRGTSTSQANGVSDAITAGESWTIGSIAQGVNSGKTTSTSRAVTSTRTRTDGKSQSRTVARAESLHKRLLLTPDEVGRYFGDRARPAALALVSGHQPVALERKAYYRLRWLEGLYGWHPDHARPETLASRQLRLESERQRLQREAEIRNRAEAMAAEVRRVSAELEAERAERAERWRRRKALALNVLGAITIAASLWPVLQLLGFASVVPVVACARSHDEPKRLSITGYYRDGSREPTRAHILVRFGVLILLGIGAHAIYATPSAKAVFDAQRAALLKSGERFVLQTRLALRR